MDIALIRRLVTEYNREVDADSGLTTADDLAARSTDDLVRELGRLGLRINREQFVAAAEKTDSVEDILIDHLPEDSEDELDENFLTLERLVRELWVRWIPDRASVEDMADVGGWMGLNYPDRGSQAGGDDGDEDDGDDEPAGNVPDGDGIPDLPEASLTVSILENLIEWLATGPEGNPAGRFEELEATGVEMGVNVENAVFALHGTDPAAALRLSGRLAQTTDLPFDWSLHADILAEQGRRGEAEEIYLRVIAQEPWNVWHLKNAALLFLGETDGPVIDAAKARHYLDRARKLAEERLAAVREGSPVTLIGRPADQEDDVTPEELEALGETPEERRQAALEIAEGQILDELSQVIEEEAILAEKTGDAARMAELDQRMAEVDEELAAMRSDGGDDDGEGDEDEDEGQDADGEYKAKNAVAPIVTHEQVGRNEVCPCGSGKKYKKCCWLKS